ncbi:MAG: nucleotidyltransferase [Bilifractor sp.]
MKVVGIIAEYNPFHNGHAYLIRKARELSGADAVVAVISGDFVQRGVPAIYDKYVRTRMALAGGCDLVLELPAASASGSAQRFAEGACAILDGIGVIDGLWFGSEAGDIELFHLLSGVLCEEPPAYRTILRKKLAEGCSFPRAREEALVACLNDDHYAKAAEMDDRIRTFLKSPNNILGLEYCLALQKKNSRIVPHTIARTGAGYHDCSFDWCNSFNSAASIRSYIFDGGDPERLKGSVPERVLEILKKAGASSAPLREDDFSDMLRYQLMCEKDRLTGYLDVTEDLAGRISKHLDGFRTFSQFAEILEAKNYTRTQINRALLHILLRIRKEDLQRAVCPEYVKVLGFTGQGRQVLSEIRNSKNAGIRTMAKTSALPEEITRTDVFASNLYEAVRSQKSGQCFVHEFSRPVILFP